MNNTKYLVKIKDTEGYKYLGYGDGYCRWYKDLQKANIFRFDTIDKAKESIVTITQTDNEAVSIATLDDILTPKRTKQQSI
jgi:hypothetical protein